VNHFAMIKMIRSFSFAVVVSLAAPASVAVAQERLMDGAMGAVAGALVGGPVGLVAGGVVGATAGPAIAHSWGLKRHRAAYRRRHLAGR
jgi:Zn-dependent protease